ncbi:MAG: alpha/beta hydrolase [Rhodospirillales bacterium]
MSDQTKDPEILTRDDGAMIAYRHSAGKSPGVTFLTGFKSDMQGGKAIALEAFCTAKGHAFTRFDYYGHGESSGAFEDGTIGRWADDAVHVLDTVTEGPQVLVGSSMGGWIMLLAALARPDRVAGLVGIAAAPDFTRDLIPPALTPDQLEQLDEQGYCDIPNCYDDQEPYRIRKSLLDEGDNHLLLNGEIALDVPVRLIQGIEDEDVPWQTALRIMERVKSRDVEIQFVKTGDHRLSEPHDLDRLTRTVGNMLENA